MLAGFIAQHKLDKGFADVAQTCYIPLAENIQKHHIGAKKTCFVGINGCQGSGKSTLSDFIRTYLTNTYQLNVVVLSLDDFYLSRSERLALAVKVHPLFATRGVPGTHNMQLARQVLDALSKKHSSIPLPRFNKATDDPYPEEQWPTCKGPVDLVIFEGWCWGVPAQAESELIPPVNALESNEDPLGVWRAYANRQLKNEYEPLYAFMDHWIMLKAPSFERVYSWRIEQEHKLAEATAAHSQSHIMSDQQIERFISHYQRLTEHGLSALPAKCQQVVELGPQREVLGITTQ